MARRTPTIEVDPARSRQMALIRGKDTMPEMLVRRLVHGMGYRYRLHRRDLPGKPDIALGRLKKAIEIRGCFWHRHPDPKCTRARLPKTRRDYWLPKLENNARRDAVNEAALRELGWDVLVVWECECVRSRRDELVSRLRHFLSNQGKLSQCPDFQ